MVLLHSKKNGVFRTVLFTQLHWDSLHTSSLGLGETQMWLLHCYAFALTWPKLKSSPRPRTCCTKSYMNWQQKDGSLTLKKNESVALASKSLNFSFFPMKQASLFCREHSLFSMYLPLTNPTCSKRSLQLDFKLQELPAQELFFYMIFSLNRDHFSRIYKYYLWHQWKRNWMNESKSRDNEAGESKDQDRELMARRYEFTELNLLFDTSYAQKLVSWVWTRSPRLLLSPLERDGHLRSETQ